MAEVCMSVSRKHLCCSICLDLLKDPVTIPCEHSFCKSCIANHWDQDDQTEVWSCPLCNQTFSPRPALNENVVLAETVEKLNRMEPDQREPCRAGPIDVGCNVCIGRKYKAVKSCVSCLCSYCQPHFDQHENLFRDERHKVTDATGRLCHLHRKPLEMLCSSDRVYICYFCIWLEHKSHDIVTVEMEHERKRKVLRETRRRFQEGIEARQNKVVEMREAVESLSEAVEDSERIFTELMPYGIYSEVSQLVRFQEKSAVSRTEELLEHLEFEIEYLRRKDAELEQISHIEDHITFLSRFQSPSEPSLISWIEIERYVPLLNNLIGLYRVEIETVSSRARSIQMPGPKTRQEFLQYSLYFTLDLNTVNEQLHLSEDNRVITYTDSIQPYPDHSDRFDYSQVLCRESVCERCYWEIEWSGDAVEISVAYKSISRKGRGGECRFGFNDQSWKCLCSPSSYSFWHNYKETQIPLPSSSSRIGVYVDHSAGILSFYSVSDTMTLIHRVQTTFTQPLYPGFGVYSDSAVKLCDLAL